MGRLASSVNKTKRYLKRNGLKKTTFAIAERIFKGKNVPKGYEPLSKEELLAYREMKLVNTPFISIVVPMYETDSSFFLKLLESVCNQTYENWELVLADASKGTDLETILTCFVDSFHPILTSDRTTEDIRKELKNRIHYHHLKENLGISDNTNVAIKYAKGEYIALLDHDDVLTLHALSEMVYAIKNKKPVLVYSDEDKMDADEKTFYEPHRKRKFNLDLILSNNYICHFTMVRSDVIKKLLLRKEYDGAQDFDLFLRCIDECSDDSEILHVPEILYHWRCHEASTASNTDSKTYAYESGRRAVEDFCKRHGWNVTVNDTSHLGFYKVEYPDGIFNTREDVGAIGGPLYRAGKICGGAMKADGTLYYSGLNRNFSGYMHRAAMVQDVSALDIRNMELRPELKELMEKSRKEFPDDDIKCSLHLSKCLREKGYLLIYDPERSAR